MKPELVESESEFILVPQDRVLSIMADVAKLLEPAVDRSDGRWTVYDVMASVLRGEMRLWISRRQGEIEAAMVTHFLQYPQMKICSIPFAGGAGLDNWKRFFADLKQWAKAQGCDEVETYDCRGGAWLRILPELEPASYQTVRVKL